MTQDRDLIDLTEENLPVVDMFVADALEYIGSPASLRQVMKVLKAHPRLRTASTTKEVVRKALNTCSVITPAHTGAWRLKEY